VLKKIRHFKTILAQSEQALDPTLPTQSSWVAPAWSEIFALLAILTMAKLPWLTGF
jgi:hypothetical protein